MSRFLENYKWKNSMGFSIYGKNFGMRTDISLNLSSLSKLIPLNSKIISFEEAENVFSLVTKESSGFLGFYWNDEIVSGYPQIREENLEIIEHKVQYVLSLILTPDKFLIHAGAVAYKGKGIIFPGQSFAGKSTLTQAFLDAGAEYYSDDCTVIDKEGLLFPYSSNLKIRGKKQNENLYLNNFGEVPNQDQGVSVKYILFCQYRAGDIWNKSPMKKGEALMGLLKNLFYAPSIREYPKETLEAFTKMVENAEIYQGHRGEARELVEDLLKKV